MRLPAPAAQPLVGHLGRWATEPLAVLAEGARLGPAFRLRLWRRTVVGWSPDWNRLVLGDLETFRSRGSMSGLSPYLGAGLVQTDAPEHRPRRKELNPSFHRVALHRLAEQIAAMTRDRLPVGTFDTVRWSSALVRDLLGELFFAGRMPAALLDAFLAPLDRPLPAPLLRRPRLFGRISAELRAALADPAPGTLVQPFARLADRDAAVAELRVALAAAYDTTAHTLAWLVWHLAAEPVWLDGMIDRAVDETLRLYPAGWIGSRVTSRPVTFAGAVIPSGTLVLYSPFLTHRDPALWPDPERFRPDRFGEPLPAWGFIPFAAGERTCLGAHLARLVLRTVAMQFGAGTLVRTGDYPGLRAGLTLAPAGPLPVTRYPARHGSCVVVRRRVLAGGCERS